jgi:hypothetical protein
MQTIVPQLGSSAIVGAAVVLPFVLLELAHRGGDGDFPIPLFGLMWLLSTTVTLILTSLVRSVRARQNAVASPAVLLRAACLIPFVWFLVLLVIDQMPCFLGVPNCD